MVTWAGTEDGRMDPRPDLEEDAEEWRVVLQLAYREGYTCFGVLHGSRSCGCKLLRSGSRIRLRPRFGEGIGDEDMWQDIREKWLLPFKDEISEIFRRAGTILEEGDDPKYGGNK